uniref:Protein arginine methyltransferase 2 n=1 Tax=Saimiri boliviensis boliviensis TaxID=39432 RepID=A0A2K6UBW6_SAIBB
MLADQPRTTKYHSSSWTSAVGLGSSVFSVYAVEASEMAQHTGQLVLQNGFADIITVFQQKVEDVVLPEKVDVLVSEWMGTCLLFEFMIESILRTGSSGPPWLRCTLCPAVLIRTIVAKCSSGTTHTSSTSAL